MHILLEKMRDFKAGYDYGLTVRRKYRRALYLSYILCASSMVFEIVPVACLCYFLISFIRDYKYKVPLSSLASNFAYKRTILSDR